MNGLLEKARLMFAHDVTVLTGIENGSVKVIPLTQGKVVIVDHEDYEWVNKIHWYAVATAHELLFYAHSALRQERMHRVIMGLQKGDNRLVDHINHNGLDNRKCNLRICTRGQNNMNRLIDRGEKLSKYKGVTYQKYVKWRAVIGHNNRNINLGSYDKEVDAALAYNKAALEYFGEFAHLNVIENI